MTECKDIPDNLLKTTNGCGSSYWLAWIFRIPKFISKELYCCCACHDLRYQWKSDKEKIDLDLRACARHLALTGPKWKKKFIWKLGDLMYWAVNTKFGDICYKKS